MVRCGRNWSATAEELGISDLVQFLGERRDIPAILASLDVTVLPSASESLSNAILESMAAGVPVIANRCGRQCRTDFRGQGNFDSARTSEALEAALLQIAE